MPVLDEAKTNILTRLKELEPQRVEYDALLEAAQQLGLDYVPNGNAQVAAQTAGRSGSPTRKTSSRRRGARKQAPTGQRREQMLEQVRAEPGITVRQVAERLGLPDATSLYRVQRQLTDDGILRKEGQGLFIVTAA